MSAPIGSPSMLQPLRPSGVQIVTAPLTGHAAAWWLERTNLVLGRVKRIGDVTVAELRVRGRLNRDCRLVIIGGPGANEYSRQGEDDDGTWATFSLEDHQRATRA